MKRHQAAIITIALSLFIALITLAIADNRQLLGLIYLLFLSVITLVILKMVAARMGIWSLGGIFICSTWIYYASPFLSIALFSGARTFDWANLSSTNLTELGWYCLIVCSGTITFFLAWHAMLKRASRLRQPIKTDDRILLPDYVKIAAIPLIVIGAALCLKLYSNMGGMSVYSRLYYVQFARQLRGLGVYAAGYNLATSGLAMLYAWGTQRRKLWPSIVCAAVGLFIFLPSLLIGDRSPVFSLISSLLIAHHLFVHKISLPKIALLGLVFAFSMMIVGNLRSVATNIGWQNAVKILSLRDLRASMDPMNSEFGTAPLILIRITRDFREVGSWLAGRTLLDDVLNVVPGSIWPNRPNPPSVWFSSFYSPLYYSQGGAYGFSWLAEGYMNLGLMGVLILGLLLGIIFGSIDARSDRNYLVALIVTVMAPLAFTMSRNDLSALLKPGLVIQVVPVLICIGCGWMLFQVRESGGTPLPGKHTIDG